MALNDSTRARFAVKALLSLGAATAAVGVYAQTKQWATAALRTWALATLTTMFMSAMVTAQAPGVTQPFRIDRTDQNGCRCLCASRRGGRCERRGRDVRAGWLRVAARSAGGQRAPVHRAAVPGLLQRVKVAAFTISPIVSSIEGDVAYDVGTYLQRLSLPDGKTIDDVGKYIVILKRTQGEWKIAYSTYNGDSLTAPMPCSGH